MELAFSTLAIHLVSDLSIIRVHMGIGVQTRRYEVGVIAHFLHDINLAIGRPGVEVHRHHPESRPCALTLGQLDASLDVAILPTFLHVGIHTTRINLAILLEAVDEQLAIHQLRDVTSFGGGVVHVVLEFVVHPTAVLHLVGPIDLVQLRTLVKLILPHQVITLGSVIGSFLSSSLGNSYRFTGTSRHHRNSTRAGLSHRISRNRDGKGTRLGCRTLGFYSEEVVAHSCAPLLSRSRDIDSISTTLSRGADTLGRDGQNDASRLGILPAPTTADKGCGERENNTIQHDFFHSKILILKS